MAWITGGSITDFGTLHGRDSLQLMSEAGAGALRSAQLERADIDGLLCGYSTTHPHLMLATVFAEHFGLQAQYANGMQVGGATGAAMIMLADVLVSSGAARNVLVVAGENRRSGTTRDNTLNTLAQVGHASEARLGAIVPAYYALVASAYMGHFGITSEQLAELAVLMRRHALRRSGAHFTTPITVEQVLASRPIADPLRILDCCPISDGGAAVVVSREPTHCARIRIRGAGQAHTHQHISAAPSLVQYGAGEAVRRAEKQGGMRRQDADYAAIYDSFTITLAILLEEIGLAPRAEAGNMARDGYFGAGGVVPLNTHGGLLGYGHAGVAGGLAHFVEAYQQMTGEAPQPLARRPSVALLHGDGGVLSSHVSMFFENVR